MVIHDLAARKALAQKYLDEYNVSEDYVSAHNESAYLWLGIALPVLDNEQPAAVIGHSSTEVIDFLAEAVADGIFLRYAELAVDLRSDTPYTPRVKTSVELVRGGYSS